MLKNIIDLFSEYKDLQIAINKDIVKLEKTKTMIEIEKKNTKRTTIENEIVDLKKKLIEELKKDKKTSDTREVDWKIYKLTIKNTKDSWGKDFEFLDIKKEV